MKNANALFLKLRSAYKRIDSDPPFGYKSTEELMVVWNLSKTHTLRMVRRFINEGILSKAHVYRNSRVVPYYGPPLKLNSTKRKR